MGLFAELIALAAYNMLYFDWDGYRVRIVLIIRSYDRLSTEHGIANGWVEMWLRGWRDIFVRSQCTRDVRYCTVIADKHKIICTYQRIIVFWK